MLERKRRAFHDGKKKKDYSERSSFEWQQAAGPEYLDRRRSNCAASDMAPAYRNSR
jgi:hypothetical protein